MKTRLAPALVIAVSVWLAPLAAHAENEIGFIEKFALAPDRATVLDQLAPGTEDYYFFHALQAQNTRQTAKLKVLLEQWAKRFPKSDRREVIENRAALLAYDTDPQATLKFLRDKLHLEFNHEQEARDQKPDLPTELDPALISRAAFQRAALEDAENLEGIQDEGLPELIRSKVKLSDAQRRDLLQRLKRPDVPGLVEVIVADLQSQESQGFGEFNIHTALLPEQLDALAKRLPDLRDNEKFVYLRLRKLAPSADADAEFDPIERGAWLDRLWAFAKNLSGSFNSVKAQILLHRLEHDRRRGVYDKARFQEYLKLPRRTAYTNPELLQPAEQAGQAADPGANMGEVLVGLPALPPEEELVRDYLLHLLKGEPAWEPWAVWLRDTWLKPIFAEAKIVNGVGDPEQWASLFSASAFQALKDRVDVDFAATNPEFLAPADDVNLDLLLKNTPKVIVKVYEINQLSFFLANHRPLDTDLALDGLVANRETTQDFSADEAGRNPFRRTLRTFRFPELKGQRGAWIIEFIGGGRSSRVLVRKGQWSLLQRTGPAGDMITVVDEARQPVKDAVVWLDGRKYTPDEKSGEIIVPFALETGRKDVVLADAAGNFAALAAFEHHAEQYRLDAQIHIEREQLLAGREATIAVRAALLLNDAQMPLELLREPKLTITAKTMDEIETTTEVKIDRLDAAKVFTHTIKVPDRLADLHVALTAQVEKLSAGGKKEEISAESFVEHGKLAKTDQVSFQHLSRFESGYVFELLGRNGEPWPDKPVALYFGRKGFEKPVSVPLRTDEKGRITCGPLDGIFAVAVKIAAEDDDNADKVTWLLPANGRTWPQSIHARAGDVLELPWTGDSAPAQVSLLEKRADTFVADRASAVLLRAGGETVPLGKKTKEPVSALTIQGLAPGDYVLTLPGITEVNIRVTAGRAVQNWLLSPNRELEVREAEPLNIGRVQREAGALVVQLANAGKFARVHVVATRFLPDETLSGGLSDFTRWNPEVEKPEKAPNLFTAGREIGDEYRYILERRYAKLFPGNMLARPGLMINPWAVRSTDLQGQRMQSGQGADAARGGRAASKEGEGEMKESVSGSDFRTEGEEPNRDFLAQPAPSLYNLVPDEKGVVRIDLKALGDRQYVQVYAEDLRSAVWRDVALAEVPTKFRDLRLTQNLDPQKPFTEKKEATVLTTGQTLMLADGQTAELETYDSLARVFTLLTTINGTTDLAKFTWVLEWPKLSEEEKRAKYSEFACHELNFFLARKDAAFFQKVVQPYLRNKKDRTFMDGYLLGNDLRRYLEPWAFARLNAAERCLLAQRLPGEAAIMAQHERDLWEMLPPNSNGEDWLFEAALHGRAMSATTEQMAPGRSAPAETVLEAPAAAPGNPKPGITAISGVPTELDFQTATNAPAGKNVFMAGGTAGMPVTAGNRSGNLAISANAIDALLFPVPQDAERQRAEVRPYFQALGTTKEWAENNYYHLPIQRQDAGLIVINSFWRDYAAWEGKAPFLSGNVPQASGSFAEMMLALAVLDLPFESPKHIVHVENGLYTLTAGGPLIAFHKEIKPAAPAAEQAPLLVSQNFFRVDDRYREEGNEKFDKYVTEEFLSGVVYGANVVVTNPTSAEQKVSVLLQIPRGALPVNGSKATDSRRLRLQPFSTETLEYYFYFPAPLAEPQPQYPVHVSRDERIVGEAKPFTFKVVQQLSQVDKTSWDYISQYAKEAEVLAFLEKANLARLDLERVAWRARKSGEFFKKLVALLEKRHVYSEPIYRYAVVHNVPGPLSTWLRLRSDFVHCGRYLDSRLLKIDAIERRDYEHLEFAPLENQRMHRRGGEAHIPNPALREQYEHLLDILVYKDKLDAMDQMSVVYYLFLQDRIEEALPRFHAIAPEALPTRLQYDCFRCYAAFYEEQLPLVRGLVQQYADYPVDRWRKLFAEVGAQLDEIEGRKPVRSGDRQADRMKQQGELAATEPSFDFKVENRQIALTWKNLREVTVRYYLMDPELLFSASPFVTQESGRFSIIKATRTDAQPLPEGKDQLTIPLPPEFTKANVLVEILGAGQRKAKAYHANTFKLQLAENYGRLEVRDATENKPVSKAYVKVYARLNNGTVRFFKDGYTDLRGRFDYASLNSSDSPAAGAIPQGAAAGESMNYQMLSPAELGQVQRFSILLMSESHGAEVREAVPPGAIDERGGNWLYFQ